MSHYTCPLCHPQEKPGQHVIFENATCYYLQHDEEQEVLEGSGLIIPKAHHQNVFELTKAEWDDTYELLHQVKKYLQEKYQPAGYTVGWNTGETGGQSIPHSHLHVIPRYTDEPYAGKGLRYWLKQKENKRERRAE